MVATLPHIPRYFLQLKGESSNHHKLLIIRHPVWVILAEVKSPEIIYNACTLACYFLKYLIWGQSSSRNYGNCEKKFKCFPRRKGLFYRRVSQLWIFPRPFFVYTSPPAHTHRSSCQPHTCPHRSSTLQAERHPNQSDNSDMNRVIDSCGVVPTGTVVVKSSRCFGQLIVSTDGLTGAMSAK